jgi:hypothetical protein
MVIGPPVQLLLPQVSAWVYTCPGIHVVGHPLVPFCVRELYVGKVYFPASGSEMALTCDMHELGGPVVHPVGCQLLPLFVVYSIGCGEMLVSLLLAFIVI